MKKIKNRSKSAILAAIVAGTVSISAASTASAQVLVGAQFLEDSSTGSSQTTATPGALYTGTGVLGESFDAFIGNGDVNYPHGPGFDGATEALGSSGVSLTVTPTNPGTDNAGFSNNGGYSSSTNFFSNFLAAHNSNFNLTLSGLTPGGTYNLALYAGDLGLRSGDNPLSLTINGTAAPFTVGPTNGGGAFIQQTATQTGNYEIVDNVTANPLGDINIVAADAGTGAFIELNGISVESVASVPEPSVWAMMLLSAGALVGFQVVRRRNA